MDRVCAWLDCVIEVVSVHSMCEKICHSKMLYYLVRQYDIVMPGFNNMSGSLAMQARPTERILLLLIHISTPSIDNSRHLAHHENSRDSDTLCIKHGDERKTKLKLLLSVAISCIPSQLP